ncbi:MAG: response regulator transcription factor [bacterium]
MDKKKVLVIDDEPDILRIVKDVLESEGFQTSSAKNAASAFKRIKEFMPDIIILDLKLPGMDGLEICKKLKSDQTYSQVPIIILSTKSEESDKVVGLELGADDYMSKPFSSAELIARVKAVLRRQSYKQETFDVIEHGDIVLDLSKRVVTFKKKALDLTPKEFELLYLLMKKKSKVLDRRFLIESIWGYEYFGTTRTVDVHIKSLREKLGKSANHIVTVEGMGYKFD